MPIPVPVIRYRTLTAADAGDLDVGINSYLAQGWSLWGSPYATDDVKYGTQYCQAMVLLKENA